MAFLFRAGVPLFMPFTLFPTLTEHGDDRRDAPRLRLDRPRIRATLDLGPRRGDDGHRLPPAGGSVRMNADDGGVTIEFLPPIPAERPTSSDALHAAVLARTSNLHG